MRNWKDYKETFTSSEEMHEAARAGELLRLAQRANDEDDIDRKNAKGYSPLMLAAYNGHFEASRYLISIGADINSTDMAGNSILMGVAFKGHIEILKLLIAHGANIHHTNHAGQNALQFAQMFGRFDCAEYLQPAEDRPRWRQQLSAWMRYINPLKRERKAV